MSPHIIPNFKSDFSQIWNLANLRYSAKDISENICGNHLKFSQILLLVLLRVLNQKNPTKHFTNVVNH